MKEAFTSTTIDIKNFKFQNLPVICQINVFQFLTDYEKCQAATVCLAWANLMRSPRLWTQADFTQIPPPPEAMLQPVHFPQNLCNTHLHQMSQFYVDSLISRKANLQILKFKFDIVEKEGIWLKLLKECLENTNSNGLTALDCDWVDTVLRSEYCRAITWYHLKPRPNLKLERTILFQDFLGILHKNSPNILSINCPFDWSLSSVVHITRFTLLKELKLTRYWALRGGMEQPELTALLSGLIHLEKLSLAVSIPIRFPMYFFKIASMSLKHLDIRACNGFYLSELDLPNLDVFREVKVYLGPPIRSEVLNVRCLLEVLRGGAPQLKMFNELELLPTWKEGVACERLSHELKKACLCKLHSNSIIY